MHTIYYSKRVRAHGWEVFRRGLKAGEKYKVDLPAGASASVLALDTLWIKGTIVGQHTETVVPAIVRTPGVFSPEITKVYPEGEMTFECLEDSIWWCHPRAYIGVKERVVSPIRIKAGDSFTFPIGTLGLIFEGNFIIDGETQTDPISFTASQEVVVTAIEDTYGFTFNRER